MRSSIIAAFVLGALLSAGMWMIGGSMVDAVRTQRSLDRSVRVKGLAEREVDANVAIWPIQFNEANNDLVALSETIVRKNAIVVKFLTDRGFTADEISIGPPSTLDLKSQRYGEPDRIDQRYRGSSTVTVYSEAVDRVRQSMSELSELAKSGVAVGGDDMGSGTQFLFTRLVDLKPGMVEEATRNAREVAEKFAADSGSLLGKIKSADQGLFSINDRDFNTRHIKKVRVVSTVEYYLTD